MQNTDSLVFHLIVSWYLFFSPVRLFAYMGQRREGMEFQWSRQVATFPRDIFKYGWREKELKASQEAPLKPSNLVWNHCMRALWSANGQAAALQPAISPHYRWDPHSQHCAYHSTWPLFDLFTELIFQQISLVLCHKLPLSISRHTCLAASLPLFACTQPLHISRDKQQVLHITQS